MKRVLLLFNIMFVISFHSYAQDEIEQKRYLLDQFTLSVATNRQGPPIQAKFNYDCVSQEMQFEEDGEVYKLDGINSIDTLYLGNYKMVPYNNRFLALIHSTPHFSLFMDYKLKIANVGKKGAFGTTTQGTVESIDVNKVGVGGRPMQMVDNSVYRMTNQSGYYLVINRKTKRFEDAKGLKKIFPGKKVEIDNYINEHKLSFKDKEAVITLIDFIIK